MVSVLAFSDDPSSNPAEAKLFFSKIVFEKNENKHKEAGVGPFKKNQYEHLGQSQVRIQSITFTLAIYAVKIDTLFLYYFYFDCEKNKDEQNSSILFFDQT